MSWDKKSRGRRGGYYYRAVRLGGKSVKQYLGSGPAAMAEAEAVRSRRRAAEEARRERGRYADLDAKADELGVVLKLLVKAELALRGFYEHKRQWRRRGRPGRLLGDGP